MENSLSVVGSFQVLIVFDYLAKNHRIFARQLSF